jgi:hypothetical protein
MFWSSSSVAMVFGWVCKMQTVNPISSFSQVTLDCTHVLPMWLGLFVCKMQTLNPKLLEPQNYTRLHPCTTYVSWILPFVRKMSLGSSDSRNISTFHCCTLSNTPPPLQVPISLKMLLQSQLGRNRFISNSLVCVLGLESLV